MVTKTDRYSLWMRPKNAEAERLQALIQRLAKQHHSPVFIPHITLIGNICSDGEDIDTQKRKVDELAGKMCKFTVALTEYGFMDEEYRCLYVLASSPQLDEAFEQASTLFPQAQSEHFSQMPHMSLLYGRYPAEEKRKIIASNPLTTTVFEVEALDLFSTSGSANDWHEVFSAELFPSA